VQLQGDTAERRARAKSGRSSLPIVQSKCTKWTYAYPWRLQIVRYAYGVWPLVVDPCSTTSRIDYCADTAMDTAGDLWKLECKCMRYTSSAPSVATGTRAMRPPRLTCPSYCALCPCIARACYILVVHDPVPDCCTLPARLPLHCLPTHPPFTSGHVRSHGCTAAPSTRKQVMRVRFCCSDRICHVSLLNLNPLRPAASLSGQVLEAGEHHIPANLRSAARIDLLGRLGSAG